MSEKANFGKNVEIEVPRGAVSVLLERADFDSFYLRDSPEVEEEYIEKLNESIKVVREALEEAEPVNPDPTTQSTLPHANEESG